MDTDIQEAPLMLNVGDRLWACKSSTFYIYYVLKTTKKLAYISAYPNTPVDNHINLYTVYRKLIPQDSLWKVKFRGTPPYFFDSFWRPLYLWDEEALNQYKNFLCLNHSLKGINHLLTILKDLPFDTCSTKYNLPSILEDLKALFEKQKLPLTVLEFTESELKNLK